MTNHAQIHKSEATARIAYSNPESEANPTSHRSIVPGIGLPLLLAMLVSGCATEGIYGNRAHRTASTWSPPTRPPWKRPSRRNLRSA